MLWVNDGEPNKDFLEYVGRTIVRIEMTGDALLLYTGPTTGLRLWDDGQSCCEHRYMCCDDDLNYFVGSRLSHFEIRDGGDLSDEYDGDCKEQQFLIVHTNKGSFTVANYNEHNGYYGGFRLKVEAM